MGKTDNIPFLFKKDYLPTDGMCVYCIENTINGKCYVGITSGFLKLRAKRHFTDLRGGYHANYYLQSSYNKYGEENFRVCSLYSNAINTGYLSVLESFYCELLQANNRNFGFNIKEPGFIKNKSKANFKFNNPVVRYPDERRKAYSERMKIANPFKGKQHSERTKAIVSQKAKERHLINPYINNLKNTTQEAKERGRIKRLGQLAGSKNPASRPVIAYDIGTQKQYLFPTVKDAATHFGLNKCTIDRISNFVKPTRTGLRFMKP